MLQRQKIAKVNVDDTLSPSKRKEINIEEIQNNVDSEIELMDDVCFVSLTFKKMLLHTENLGQK